MINVTNKQASMKSSIVVMAVVSKISGHKQSVQGVLRT